MPAAFFAGDSVTTATSDNATTNATIGLGAVINVTGGSELSAFSITASHLATADTEVSASAYGFLSGAGVNSSNNITSNVNAQSSTVRSPRLAIMGHAENDFSHPGINNNGDNISGDTAGLASAAGGSDISLIDFSTIVDVGSSAVLNVIGAIADPGSLSLSANNSFTGYDQLTFKTGGALAGAEALVDIQTYSPNNPAHGFPDNTGNFDEPAGGPVSNNDISNGDLAEVNIESGASLSSVGQIVLAVDGTANITTQVNTDTYGAVTAAKADSDIDIRPNNRILIGSAGGAAVTLNAFGDVNLLAGEDAAFNMDSYTANAYVDAYAGALIPLSSVNAHAFVVQANLITVNSNVTINTGGDANLMANSVGFADVLAQAKSTSWASDVGDAILTLTGGNPANQFNGTGFSVSHGIVEVDGAIHTGISSNQFHVNLLATPTSTSARTRSSRTGDAGRRATWSSPATAISIDYNMPAAAVPICESGQRGLHRYVALEPDSRGHHRHGLELRHRRRHPDPDHRQYGRGQWRRHAGAHRLRHRLSLQWARRIGRAQHEHQFWCDLKRPAALDPGGDQRRRYGGIADHLCRCTYTTEPGYVAGVQHRQALVEASNGSVYTLSRHPNRPTANNPGALMADFGRPDLDPQRRSAINRTGQLTPAAHVAGRGGELRPGAGHPEPGIGPDRPGQTNNGIIYQLPRIRGRSTSSTPTHADTNCSTNRQMWPIIPARSHRRSRSTFGIGQESQSSTLYSAGVSTAEPAARWPTQQIKFGLSGRRHISSNDVDRNHKLGCRHMATSSTAKHGAKRQASIPTSAPPRAPPSI